MPSRIALIDLTKGTTTDKVLPETMYRQGIGGVGLGVRILFENGWITLNQIEKVLEVINSDE